MPPAFLVFSRPISVTTPQYGRPALVTRVKYCLQFLMLVGGSVSITGRNVLGRRRKIRRTCLHAWPLPPFGSLPNWA